MKRYWKIYKTLMRLNMQALMAYKLNFVNSVVSSLVWGTVSILMIFLMTAKTSAVFGWSRNELIFLVTVYNIIMSTFHIIFSRNFERFSQILHKGDLDGVLIKPIDSQFAMSLWMVNYTAIIRVIAGISFSIYLLILMNVTPQPIDIFLFIIFMIAGITIMYSIWFMVATLMIWVTNLSNLIGVLYEVNGMTRYPEQIYKNASAILFYIIMPLTFVVITPVKTLLHRLDFADVFFLLFFAVVLFLCSRFFWKFALRFYTSAS